MRGSLLPIWPMHQRIGWLHDRCELSTYWGFVFKKFLQSVDKGFINNLAVLLMIALRNYSLFFLGLKYRLDIKEI